MKIQKGELRYGTLVTISEHDSWQWRHWYAHRLSLARRPHVTDFLLTFYRGCITPKQIANLLTSIDGEDGLPDDLDIIDGYEDVGEENQAKIRTALQQGHVPDQDWKGVSDFILHSHYPPNAVSERATFSYPFTCI